MKSGAWIVYTSADSVFQIAAHEEIIPLSELYKACQIARRLCNPLRVGRVIARPFIGKPGMFKRTENRRDFSMPLPEPCIINKLIEADIPVASVGKIDDIFPSIPFNPRIHVENNLEAEKATLELCSSFPEGLIFTNLIDFDMLYGHRRDPDGYANALRQADNFLAELSSSINKETDIIIVTADHGNDPTFHGTDHTREYVPLLVFNSKTSTVNLGIRKGFFDVAASIASFFQIKSFPRGISFL